MASKASLISAPSAAEAGTAAPRRSRSGTIVQDMNLLDRGLLKVGSYLFIWVIGVVACITLITHYSEALKPLVVAMLTVSILEWIVQALEWLQWKAWGLLFLFLSKIKVVVLALLLCVYWLALRIFSVLSRREYSDLHVPACCQSLEERQIQTEIGEGEMNYEKFFGLRFQRLWIDMKSYRRIIFKWQPIFAGKNMFFRTVAIIVTLLFVVAVFAYTMQLITYDVQSMDLEGYKHTFQEIINWTNHTLDDCQQQNTTGFLDQRMHSTVAALCNQMQGNLRMDSALVRDVQSYILDVVQSCIGASSGVVIQVVFYLLYTLLWLFDPLHLNTSDRQEDSVTEVFSVCNMCYSDAKLCEVDEEGYEQLEGGPTKLQPTLSHRATSGLRDLEKKFYSFSNDPRQDLQERLYRIMRVYFTLKMCTNGLCGLLFFGMLQYLGSDLSSVLGFLCFLLNFIPELGAMIAMSLPLPVLLLMPSASLHFPKYQCFGLYMLGCMLIKLFVSNILEAYVMGSNRVLAGAVENNDLNKIKETHPVIILFFVVLLGEIWGPLGMLVAVPLISLVRLSLTVWRMDPATADGAAESKHKEP